MIEYIEKFSDLLLAVVILFLAVSTGWIILARAWRSAERIPERNGDEDSNADALLDDAVQQNVQQNAPVLTPEQVRVVDKSVRLSAVLSTFRQTNSLYETALKLNLSWREVQAVLGANGYRIYRQTPPEIRALIAKELLKPTRRLKHTEIAVKYDVTPKVVEAAARALKKAAGVR